MKPLSVNLYTCSFWASKDFFSFLKSSLDASKAADPSLLSPLFSLLSSTWSPPPSPISSPARFSQDSSGSSSPPFCSSWLGDWDACKGPWFCCCCLSRVKSREMNWSRGLLAAVRLSSRFCCSLSLHSSHTSLYVGGRSWCTDWGEWEDYVYQTKVRAKEMQKQWHHVHVLPVLSPGCTEPVWPLDAEPACCPQSGLLGKLLAHRLVSELAPWQIKVILQNCNKNRTWKTRALIYAVLLNRTLSYVHA